MQHTDNHNLIIKEKTDNYSRERFNECMNILDNAIAPFYVAAVTDNANVYQIITGTNKTELKDGYSIKIAIPSASTGAVSIIVDNVTVAVKKVNGNAVSNFKANGVYALTYFNGNFILASGVDDSDSTSVGTDGSNVKVGETFIGSDGEIHTGTFTEDGTAAASHILNGKTAYVKGKKVTGNIQSLGATTYIAGTSDKTIPAGKYLSGAQTIKGYPNCTAANIVSGKIINGVTGSATIQSLGGFELYTGSVVSGSTGVVEITGFNFTPKFVLLWDGSTGFGIYRNGSMAVSYIKSQATKFSDGESVTACTKGQFKVTMAVSGGTVWRNTKFDFWIYG